MTLPFTTPHRTLHRLHRTALHNLTRRHTTTNKNPPHPTPPPQRTIPLPTTLWHDPLLRPFRAYAAMQSRSPYTTQLASSLVIYYLGDLGAQTLSTTTFTTAPYDPLRALRAMAVGGLASIPAYHWFLFLGSHFNYGSHIASLAVKIVVNQSFFTPVFNSYFFGMHTALGGGGWGDVKSRVKGAVPTSCWNSWKLWPAVTAVSFTFVPAQSRAVFAGGVAVGWQGYLGWLNERVGEGGRVGGGECERLGGEERVGAVKAAEGGQS